MYNKKLSMPGLEPETPPLLERMSTIMPQPHA